MGTPSLSRPLESRSSERTYMIPIKEPIQLFLGPRSLKISSPCLGLEFGMEFYSQRLLRRHRSDIESSCLRGGKWPAG